MSPRGELCKYIFIKGSIRIAVSDPNHMLKYSPQRDGIRRWGLAFAPLQGTNLHPLRWTHRVLTTGLPGKPLVYFLLKYNLLL